LARTIFGEHFSPLTASLQLPNPQNDKSTARNQLNYSFTAFNDQPANSNHQLIIARYQLSMVIPQSVCASRVPGTASCHISTKMASKKSQPRSRF